jgi:hypothetical protein
MITWFGNAVNRLMGMEEGRSDRRGGLRLAKRQNFRSRHGITAGYFMTVPALTESRIDRWVRCLLRIAGLSF